MSGAPRPCFDQATGSLDPAAFRDETVFRGEQPAIFGRSMQLVGAAKWLAEAGDYLATRLGAEPALIWRFAPGPDGLLVLSDRCPGIGGRRIAATGRGTARSLTCGCHGWEFTPGDLARMGPTGRASDQRGLLFASLSPTARDPFGGADGFDWYWNRALDAIGERVEVAGSGPLVWTVAANWKLAAMAYAGDAAAHASEPVMHMAGRRGAAVIRIDERGNGPEPTMVRATMFPNLSYDAETRSLHVCNPLSPVLTEVRSYALVRPDATSDEQRAALRRMIFHFGPTGIVTMDEARCWQSIARNCADSRQAIRFCNDEGRALQHNLPGPLYPAITDAGPRAFLDWWQGVIATAAWGGDAAASVRPRHPRTHASKGLCHAI